jgi:hypothetical protein
MTGSRLQVDVTKRWIKAQSRRVAAVTLPDMGIPGYDHLYTADKINAAGTEPTVASVVHTWWDQGAPHEAMADASGTTAGGTIEEESGLRFLRINTPPAAAIGSAWTDTNKPRTLVAIVRTAQLTVNFLQAVGYRVRRITGGNYELSNGTDLIGIAGDSNWTLLMVVIDGANSVFRVNATEVAASTAFAPGAAVSPTGITLGTGSATDYTPFDYAAIATWPRALTLSERETVRSVLKARYSVLP